MKRPNRQDRVSDRALVALLEDEVTTSERHELERALLDSADLRRRHQRLSALRALLQSAEGERARLDLVSAIRERARRCELPSTEPGASSLQFLNWIRRVPAWTRSFARTVACRPTRTNDD